jgi:hypothetical protein
MMTNRVSILKLASLAAVFLIAASAPAQVNNAVYARPFSAITAASTSAILPNIGQSQHLLVVIFPSELGAVSSLQIRIEASFDNSAWFPISKDITEAPLVGGLVYAMTVGYGAFPFVRVRSLAATPGMEELTAYYSGNVVPIQTVVQEQSDRFIL